MPVTYGFVSDRKQTEFQIVLRNDSGADTGGYGADNCGIAALVASSRDQSTSSASAAVAAAA